MTKHITYDHKCSGCQALYIPYDDRIPCPKCGMIEKDRFDFIPQAAESALFNLKNGSFEPMGWWVSSYADHLLIIIFSILEEHRKSNESGNFTSVARAFVDKLDWKDQEYSKEYVYNIVCRVYEEIQKKLSEPDSQSTIVKKWWQFWK